MTIHESRQRIVEAFNHEEEQSVYKFEYRSNRHTHGEECRWDTVKAQIEYPVYRLYREITDQYDDIYDMFLALDSGESFAEYVADTLEGSASVVTTLGAQDVQELLFDPDDDELDKLERETPAFAIILGWCDRHSVLNDTFQYVAAFLAQQGEVSPEEAYDLGWNHVCAAFEQAILEASAEQSFDTDNPVMVATFLEHVETHPA